MLKFLIILSLTVYIVSKIGGFFFRIGASSQQPRRPVNRNGYPDSTPPKERKGGKIKGGEYVDYEEVK